MFRRSFVKGLAALPLVGLVANQLQTVSAEPQKPQHEPKKRPQRVTRYACGCVEIEDLEDAQGEGAYMALVQQPDACDQNPSICDEQSGRKPISVTEE